MNAPDTCQECGLFIHSREKRCACGWLRPKSQTLVQVDHRCAYALVTRRCPLDGTMSPGVKASDEWYCRLHYQTQGGPKLSEAALYHAEKNYDELMGNREDWRDALCTANL